MHFLSCFDVIVVSVYGRFQIKLWRVLAFKPVISGDYLAAVELRFLFFFFFFGRGARNGLCDSVLQRRYQMPIAYMQVPWTPTAAEETDADWVWGERNKTHSPNLGQKRSLCTIVEYPLISLLLNISRLWCSCCLLTEQTQPVLLFQLHVWGIGKTLALFSSDLQGPYRG